MSLSKKTSWPLYLKAGVVFVIVFSLWIFNRNYISPLLLGGIVAVLSYPLYTWIYAKIERFTPKNARSIAAACTLLFLTLVLGVAGNLFIRQFIREIPNFARSIIEFIEGLPNNQGLVDIAQNLGFSRDVIQTGVDQFQGQLTTFTHFKTQDVSQIDSQLLSSILNYGQRTVNAVFDFAVFAVVFLLAWYNALTLGPNWLKNTIELLPLTNDESKSIQSDLRDGIRNVVYANLLSGGIHALVCFILMLVFGIPNVFILTTIIFFIGVLPLTPSELGYSLVIVPIFFTNPLAAVILIPIAELIILWVNYVLTPKVIASGEEGNPLLILTSILSGIAIFGLMGFIIAPVIMVFVQTLYRILLKRLQNEHAA